MSIQVQSIFRLCKCANAARPMRRMLLSGFPLVLTTRYFGMIGSRPYAVATNFQPASVLANEASGTSDMAGKAARVAVERSGSCRDTRRLRRQKNFSGVRIFHRRAGSETAHIDVTAVR